MCLCRVCAENELVAISEDTDKLFAQIKRAEVEFEAPYWDGVSKEAISCIKAMLEANPDKRPTAAQVLQHPVFTAAEGEGEKGSGPGDGSE